MDVVFRTQPTLAMMIPENARTWSSLKVAFGERKRMPYDEAVEACREHEKGTGKTFVNYCITSGWISLENPELIPEQDFEPEVEEAECGCRWVNLYWDLDPNSQDSIFVGCMYHSQQQAESVAVIHSPVLRYISTISVGAVPDDVVIHWDHPEVNRKMVE